MGSKFSTVTTLTFFCCFELIVREFYCSHHDGYEVRVQTKESERERRTTQRIVDGSVKESGSGHCTKIRAQSMIGLFRY